MIAVGRGGESECDADPGTLSGSDGEAEMGCLGEIWRLRKIGAAGDARIILENEGSRTSVNLVIQKIPSAGKKNHQPS